MYVSSYEAAGTVKAGCLLSRRNSLTGCSTQYKNNCTVLPTDHELIPAVFSAVPGEYRACRWTEDFLLVSDK
jgi:hypothetical protein